MMLGNIVQSKVVHIGSDGWTLYRFEKMKISEQTVRVWIAIGTVALESSFEY